MKDQDCAAWMVSALDQQEVALMWPPDALWAARETAGPSSWSREHVLQTDACHLKGEMIWWLKQVTREL